MSNCVRRIVLGAALLAGVAMAASAQTMTAPGENPGPQIATLPPSEAAPANNAITLPEVAVLAPRTYPQPYANGGGPRVSSYSIPRSEHYQASPDYRTNTALHPYSNGLGPRASSQGTVRAEHYQVPPGYDQNDAMHPYTSGHGPCPQGGAGKVVCTDMIPSSRHNR
jgi:hypothetical protein